MMNVNTLKTMGAVAGVIILGVLPSIMLFMSATETKNRSPTNSVTISIPSDQNCVLIDNNGKTSGVHVFILQCDGNTDSILTISYKNAKTLHKTFID